MREQTCCFTGHRELPVWGREQLAEKLEDTITGLIDRGIRFYGAGGARGFDTLAAGTVLKLKPSYPKIKLILVLPCLTQTRGWRPEDIAEYERIKAQADKVVYTAQQYARGCMHKRNRHLVDNYGLQNLHLLLSRQRLCMDQESRLHSGPPGWYSASFSYGWWCGSK